MASEGPCIWLDGEPRCTRYATMAVVNICAAVIDFTTAVIFVIAGTVIENAGMRARRFAFGLHVVALVAEFMMLGINLLHAVNLSKARSVGAYDNSALRDILFIIFSAVLTVISFMANTLGAQKVYMLTKRTLRVLSEGTDKMSRALKSVSSSAHQSVTSFVRRGSNLRDITSQLSLEAHKSNAWPAAAAAAPSGCSADGVAATVSVDTDLPLVAADSRMSAILEARREILAEARTSGGVVPADLAESARTEGTGGAPSAPPSARDGALADAGAADQHALLVARITADKELAARGSAVGNGGAGAPMA